MPELEEVIQEIVKREGGWDLDKVEMAQAKAEILAAVALEPKPVPEYEYMHLLYDSDRSLIAGLANRQREGWQLISHSCTTLVPHYPDYSCVFRREKL